MKKIRLLFIISVLNVSFCIAQSDRVEVKTNYSYVDMGQTDNGEDISFNNYSTNIGIPQFFKKKDYFLMHNFYFGTTNIGYGRSFPGRSKVDEFYTFSYMIGGVFPIKNNWNLFLSCGVSGSSNLDGGLQADELQPISIVMFSKEINPNLQLSFGTAYMPGTGIDIPLPALLVDWNMSKRWNMKIGIPDFELNYRIGEKTTIGTNLFMTGDQYTFSRNVNILKSSEKVDNLDYLDFGVGIGFNQVIGKHLQLNLKSGYTFYRNIMLQNRKTDVYEMNADNSYYVSAGLLYRF